MNQIPDRYDKCPCCGTSWNGGNIRDVLGNMDVNRARGDRQIDSMAAEYGYTEENQKRFTNTKGIQIGDQNFFQCNNCSKVWCMGTGERYNSLQEVYHIVYKKKEPVA